MRILLLGEIVPLETLTNLSDFTSDLNNPESPQGEIELTGFERDDLIFIIFNYSLANIS
jgi:hypothetical protein